MRGRALPLSVPRRLICDLMHFASGVPTVPVQRRMALAPVIAARQVCPYRPPWTGIFVPAKTPKDIVDRLSKELQTIMKSPEVVKLLTDQYVLPFPSTPEQFTALIKADTEKWGKVIKDANIKLD